MVLFGVHINGSHRLEEIWVNERWKQKKNATSRELYEISYGIGKQFSVASYTDASAMYACLPTILANKKMMQSNREYAKQIIR